MESQLEMLQRELRRTLEQIGHVLAAPNERAVAAAAAKLKYSVPKTQESFHDALDQLTSQIQHAQLVMRRDLAVQTEAPKPETPKPLAAAPSPMPAGSPAKAPSPKIPSEPDVPATAVSDGDFELTTALDGADKPSTDDHQTGDQPIHDSQPNDATDNDNISALLPGLQDYANNQPEDSGDPDFDDIFGIADLTEGAEGDQGAVDGMENFLDFDFGADFGGAGGVDDANGTTNANGNIDDEIDFFKFD